MKKWIVTCFVVLTGGWVMAQQTTFTATVNRNSLSLNDRFQLTLTLTNGGNIKDYKAPSMGDFIVLGGPNQSSSFSSINGQVSQSVSYSYVLQPKSAGKFTIGSAYVKTNGQTLATQPISIEVVDQPSSTQNNQSYQNNKNSGNQGSSSQNSGAQSDDQDINDYIRKNAYIKTEISDGDIYKGESSTVTLKLYVNDNSSIYGYRILQAIVAPKYDGFYSQDIDLGEQQATHEYVNGQSYSVSIIKKTILTPQKTGKLLVDPITLDAVFGVQVKKQRKSSGDPMQDMIDDFFNNPFGNSAKEVRFSLSSQPAYIQVNELPANAPDDFNGAVGSFTMKTDLNATATKTDEPLTYHVTINGTGNLELFNPPVLNLPPGWETYDPKVSKSGNGKTYEYLLIPRSPGDFTIPAYSWSYLDPAKKKYITLKSPPYKVKVEAGPGYNPSAGNYAVNKEDVEMLAKDIRYINKDTPHYENAEHHFFGGGAFYTLLGFPLLAGAGLFIFTAKKKKLESDVVTLKNRRANTVARKRMSGAAALMNQPNRKLFYDEIIKTLWGYLSDKINISTSELTKENIRELLISKKASLSSADATIALLDTCEIALFAPSAIVGTPQETYQKTIDLITQLENEIK